MNKEERILKSAFELFCRNGFAETDIESIAKKAGVAKGTVYLYFKNKNELFMRSMIFVFDEFDAQVKILMNERETYREKLKEFISLNIHIMLTNNIMSKMLLGELYNVLKKENAMKLTSFREKMGMKFVELEALIRAGIKNGEFRDVDPVSASTMIMGGMNMIVMRNSVNRKNESSQTDIRKIQANMIETVFRLLDKEVK